MDSGDSIKAVLDAADLKYGGNYYRVLRLVEEDFARFKHLEVFRNPDVSDEQLLEALKKSKSITSAVHSLGVSSPSDTHYERCYRLAEEHGLKECLREPIQHITDEQWVEALSSAKSVQGAIKKLGIKTSGDRYKEARRVIGKHNLPTRVKGKKEPVIVSDEELLKELLACKTQKEAMLKLGLGVGGESYKRCRRVMQEYKLLTK